MTPQKIFGSGVRGRVSVCRVDDQTGLRIPLFAKPNQIQFSWGAVAAQQLGFAPRPGRPSYHIAAMYVEYENLSNPDLPVSVAGFGRDLGIVYYNELVDSSVQDFLRVPLRLDPTISITSGHAAYFTAGQGNQLTFFAQTAGNAGMHNKTFSHTVNSKVYAVSLVATPNFSDRTQDIIFARTYFDIGDQTVKEASSQIGITWDIAFE